MSNSYFDRVNDSRCNKISDKLKELQNLYCFSTDFTNPIQVQMYNNLIDEIKITSQQLHKIELEK